MSNELTEEQVENLYNRNRSVIHHPWSNLSEFERGYILPLVNTAYRLGRESVETERTGWTDRELRGAVNKGTLSALSSIPVPELRRILTALGIDHEPPKPEPGTRYVTMNGDLAFVDPIGRIVVVEADGTMMIRAVDEPWPELTPARVIEDGEQA